MKILIIYRNQFIINLFIRPPPIESVIEESDDLIPDLNEFLKILYYKF